MALSTPFQDGKIKGMSGGKSEGKKVGKKLAKMNSSKGGKK